MWLACRHVRIALLSLFAIDLMLGDFLRPGGRIRASGGLDLNQVSRSQVSAVMRHNRSVRKGSETLTLLVCL
jgi:hypothetical protein